APRGGGDPALRLRGRGGAGVGGLRLPPVPVGPNLLASLRRQKLNVQYRAAGRARSPTERRSPGAWGSRGAGSRTLQAAGPGLIDSEPVDTVLRALVLELGLDSADEM
ncbi:CITE1 protein, partial [Origma solitaria]|nr:CITE1 protein [Origma solitaria]